MKRIAIQGIEGAFHEIAAIAYFGTDIEAIHCTKFKQIVEAVQTGDADYGIIAIENTIAGSILENYSLLKESRNTVIGEISLPINQNLMALPDTKIENIKEVYSHPIAISQSKEFFNDKQNIKLIEWSDTASSAKKIATEKLPNTAAIASEHAAKLYGLEIIARKIETNTMNYTRFLIITRRSNKKTENNKASICFELAHEPGTLVDILQIFKNRNINLTKIQSLPILGCPYEYSFYLDLEWGITGHYNQALTEVLLIASNLSVLGEYKRDEKFNHEILN